MIEKLRLKLLEFIYSEKDVPILAGFSVGFYLLLFYYSKNFTLANSWLQLLFFIGYYILIPAVVLFSGYKLLSILKLQAYKKNLLFVGMLAFFAFYFLEINHIQHPRRILLGVVIIAFLLSIKLKKFYKLFIVLLFFMSIFNVIPVVNVLAMGIQGKSDWKTQPDGIEKAVFKSKPNIYYIQPDGYTNPANLRDTLHKFDNRDFEAFLKNNGFTIYEKHHSNYYSTLLSNTSMFSMKHHYVSPEVEKYDPRSIVVSDNAVLRTLKHNGYKTSFISEKPYFLMNRPNLGYDFCNIPEADIPFIKDGWALNYDVFAGLKKRMAEVEKTGNFFFIEKFTPGHIAVYKTAGSNMKEEVEKEKDKYLSAVKEANIWLKDVLAYIQQNDPNAIVVIGADHGGFAGFAYSLQTDTKTTNKTLVNSMFGSLLAIKWNDSRHVEYDTDLKSSVNLYRILFSYLSQDKKYLDNLQDNSSYIHLKEPKGLYRYINDKGEVVFEKADHVQD